jgi:hypothetical protein
VPESALSVRQPCNQVRITLDYIEEVADRQSKRNRDQPPVPKANRHSVMTWRNLINDRSSRRPEPTLNFGRASVLQAKAEDPHLDAVDWKLLERVSAGRERSDDLASKPAKLVDQIGTGVTRLGSNEDALNDHQRSPSFEAE